VGATIISAISESLISSTILTVSNSGNLLANSSFENGTTNWVHGQTGTSAALTGTANTGSRYAQLSLPGSGSVTQDTLISADNNKNALFYSVSQGQTLTFGGWANVATGNGKVRYTIALYDGNKAAKNFISTPNASSGTWTQLNGSYVVPAGISFVKIYAQIYNPTTTTTGNFDDVYLLVTPPQLQSITVTPSSSSIVVANSQQFTASGNYSGSFVQDITNSVTWGSSSTSVATINTSGLATGQGAGTTTITAASGAVRGAATLNVTATSTLLSISVSPPNPTISGGSQQFTATGSYNDGTTSNITTSVTWTSSNTGVATISNSNGSQGLATTMLPPAEVGYTIITATSGPISGSTRLAVSRPGSLNGSIRHIIVLLQENRSFDNYFGAMGSYRALRGYNDPFDGTPDKAIPDKSGVLVAPFHFKTVCHENTTPSWNASHAYYDRGALDQFMGPYQIASTIDPDNTRAMGYYNETDLPYYYDLTFQFATSDRYFAPVLAPTIPNRMYSVAGTSFGHINDSDTPPSGGYTQKTIFDALSAAGVSWRYYYQDIHHNMLNYFSTYYKIHKSVPISGWYADIQNENTLPSVIFIDRKGDGGADEHPNTNIQTGATDVKQIFDALLQSPSWATSVVIWGFDEPGGLYEHVLPPAALAPEQYPAQAKCHRLEGRLQSVRLPGADDLHIPVGETSFCFAYGSRPHVDLEVD